MSFLTIAALLAAGLHAASNEPKPATKPDLAAAVRAGDKARIKQLIEKQGADPNAKDASGTPVLMTAVVYGDAECVRILLDHGADANAKNPAGATALVWAAGDRDKTSLLLKHGADVNVQSALGRTPLLVAASQDGAGAVVAKLIEKGARVDVTDKLTGIPVIPTGGGSGTPLIEAAKARDGEALRMLLAKGGVDVNAKEANGGTALSEAVVLGNLANVKALLKAGAQVNIGVTVGKTSPLALAAFRNDPELVKTLLDAGADVNARDGMGNTPLMWAAYSERGDARVVEMLIEAGADVNARNNRRESPMTWAMWNGETAITTALKKAGAAVDPYPAAAPASARLAAADLRAAVEKGVSVLQPPGPVFVKKSGCVSCHHQALPAVAVGMAKQRGWHVDTETADRDLKATVGFLKPATEVLFEGSDVVPQVPQTGGYLLMGLAAQGYPADDTTTAIVHNIAQKQRLDGAWTGWAPRPPITGGDIRETAVAIYGLKLYAPAGRKAEFDGRITRAASWLAKAQPATPEEAISKLLGLAWANADEVAIRIAAADVLGAQRADGGWAQLKSRESDAYATGEALYALRKAGVLTASSAEYRKGAQYLLSTQEADGSWHVKTRAFPFQPLVDSGFPHGRDQWISSMGTSWALVALMM